ncbi:tetratricopeptide repeat protein [Actinoplanes sp. NEAU-A12]|uniref:Tetratricopeptide repeat protein n=1 Tax=Actinoplanes sandaracinus TaxID=3045177 RepID=A0ABT6X0U4_9ACTN|nr:tetratricopeptide repeat protein [Actinoplanes sandaracinus]MDI6105471.1 tetratricopeptide repeat protein [Actinoplanes sandaracinus]
MRRAAMLIAVSILGALLLVTAGALLAPGDDRAPASRETARHADPIAAAQRRLQRLPNDWTTWAQLGMAYVQRARTAGDQADYPRAEEALDRSLAIRPRDNAIALTGLGALAAARHDFPAALRHGRDALAVDPYRAAALGVVVDALTELGRYEEAFAAVQQMVDLRPDAASYSRASYSWELRGELGRATEAMQRALAAAPEPADGAFARLHLGELAMDSGDLDTASAHFTEGLRLLPGHPPLRAEQARVRAARGDLAGAIAGFRSLLATAPEPAYIAELGDLLTAAGQPAEGERQHARARQAWAAEAGQGHPPEADPVLFAADHRDPAALEAARRLYDRQPGISGADAMGWALRAAGRLEEALTYADEALALGTRDALMHYHRGMILAELGRRDAARADLSAALRFHPHFSVRHAPVARETLTALGAAR